MKFNGYMISDAEEDILDIYNHISISDSIEKAEQLIQKIKETCLSLSELPKRGHIPPELERIGVVEYRENRFKPYRIIYQAVKSNVYIQCILDSRRELHELLEKRILR
jgi:toxin ParE1/3/4